MNDQKHPTLPVADSPTAFSGHKCNVKRVVLTVAGALTIFALARSSYPADLDVLMPECLRSLASLKSDDVEASKYKSSVPELGVPEKIQRRWGQYSPYYPAGKYVAPPDGCVIDQVNIVRSLHTMRLVQAPLSMIASSNATALATLIMTMTTRLL